MHGEVLSKHATYRRAKIWLKSAREIDPDARIQHLANELLESLQ